MAILDFGSANIDYVYALDHITLVGETLSSSDLRIFPGGKGLNQAIALARAGAPVCFAGAVGTDGALLVRTLSENQVDVSHLAQVSEKSGHAIIQVGQAGENCIIVYPGANHCITRPQIDRVLSHFSPGDFLLLQNEISNLPYLLEQARKKELRIFLNPSPIDQAILDLDLHKLSYLILNEVEAQAITGADTPEACLAVLRTRYPQLAIMLTLGDQGCIYADPDQTIRQPIFDTQAVDTTAAGDTFTGYFIAGLSAGLPIAEVLRQAACAAAIAVSRHGAAPSIPYLHEVQKGLTEMQVKTAAARADSISRKLELYLSDHLATASLGDFAATLQYTSAYTGSLIQKATGLHFKAHLQRARIRRAADLLLTTDLPITDIIRAVGYENAGFFREIFKRSFGLNPLQYRNQGGHTHDNSAETA